MSAQAKQDTCEVIDLAEWTELPPMTGLPLPRLRDRRATNEPKTTKGRDSFESAKLTTGEFYTARTKRAVNSRGAL